MIKWQAWEMHIKGKSFVDMMQELDNGNVVARIVSKHQMTDLKTLLKEAKEGKLYYVYEGKDGKPEAVEVCE